MSAVFHVGDWVLLPRRFLQPLLPQVADIYNRLTGNTPQTSTSDELAAAMQRVANNQGPKSPGLHVTESKVNAPAPEATRTRNETSEALAKVMERIRSQQ